MNTCKFLHCMESFLSGHSEAPNFPVTATANIPHHWFQLRKHAFRPCRLLTVCNCLMFPAILKVLGRRGRVRLVIWIHLNLSSRGCITNRIDRHRWIERLRSNPGFRDLVGSVLDHHNKASSKLGGGAPCLQFVKKKRDICEMQQNKVCLY